MIKMYRPYKSFFKSWLYSFLCSFIYFFQGIVGIITIGFYIPTWEYDIVFWSSKRSIKEKLRNGKVKNNA